MNSGAGDGIMVLTVAGVRVTGSRHVFLVVLVVNGFQELFVVVVIVFLGGEW